MNQTSRLNSYCLKSHGCIMKFYLLIGLVASSYADHCYDVPGPIQPKEKLTVSEAFKKYKIVDDYIPEAPEDIFQGSHEGNELKLGTVLSPLITTTPISLSYPNGKEGEKYTAVLLGIDSPFYGTVKSAGYIQAMFVNSPADDILKGDLVVPFSPPVPVLNSGEHRYVGLLYKQNGTLDPDTKDMLMLARHRAGFSAVDFADHYGLGKPVAGNFFLTSLTSCNSQ